MMSHHMSHHAGYPAAPNLRNPPPPMVGTAEQCASFLMALKHRSVSPDLVEDASQVLFERMKNEAGVYVDSGTDPTQPSLTRNDEMSHHGNHELMAPAGTPLALPEDGHWLSDLQCYVRSHCCEFFMATEADAKMSSSASTRAPKPRANAGSSNSGTGGRRGPITVGRVGIRCVFCRDVANRASQSTSYPSQISGIYGAVVMMQCRHFPNCTMMPIDVRDTLAAIKGTRNVSPPPGALPLEKASPSNSSGPPGRQQYWADSARRLGLVDTEEGIRFSPSARDPSSPNLFAPVVDPSEAPNRMVPTMQEPTSSKKHKVTPDLSPQDDEPIEIPDLTLPNSLNALMGETTLIAKEDMDLVPDYLFLAMAQMKPCVLSDVDKVGCYKDRPLGFRGMSCKHCGGQPGFGKYFPATVRSLAQTTTSQTILKHVSVKCRLCPPDIRKAVVALQKSGEHNEKTNYARGPTNDGRPRYGSRKVFFQRVWGRLHDEEVPDIPPEEDLAPAPKSKKRSRDKQAIVTPDDSEEEVSSLDGSNSDSESSGARTFEDEMSDTDDDDESSILTDNLNRRVTIRVGGSTQGNQPRKKRRRAAPVLPLAKNAARKKRGGAKGKRTRVPQ